MTPEERDARQLRAGLCIVAFVVAFVGSLVGTWTWALVEPSEDVTTAIALTCVMLWGVVFILLISLME